MSQEVSKRSMKTGIQLKENRGRRNFSKYMVSSSLTETENEEGQKDRAEPCHGEVAAERENGTVRANGTT